MPYVNLFGQEMKEVVGVVERVGPYFGNGTSAGIILLLEGDNTAYVVMRHMGESDGLIGLTQVGDSVCIQVSAAPDSRKTVYHSHIKNITLNTRLQADATKF